MTEHKKPQYHFFVDAKKYDTDNATMTGAEIKAQANVSSGYQLFLEVPGNDPDRAVSDGESINLAEKVRHFYAVPPATFGQR